MSARIYTRRGDQGQTDTVGGRRVAKNSPRVTCSGELDELNSSIGVAREAAAGMEPLADILLRVQHELFDLGATLVTLPESAVEQLENEIDAFTKELPPLKNFILPGGSRLGAQLHVCRTVCRRAERALVSLAAVETVHPEALAYLNRLSDALFVFSRWANLRLGAPETLWNPRRTEPPR